MMKKSVLLGCALLTTALLTGCSNNLKNNDSGGSTSAPETTTAVPGETSAPTAKGSLRTGMAVISSAGNSKDATADADGLGQIDTTVVALTLDSDGRIENCVIDGVQSKIYFSRDGKLLSDINTSFESKNMLGERYGMKAASKIGREWSEEAAALAEYVKGKTIEEVKGIATTPEGIPTGADLAASVTFKIGDCVDAIEKAAANANDLGAKPGDRLGLAVDTDMAKSKDAQSNEDGVAEAASTFTALTVDNSGKITSCIIDASQSSITFDTEGRITSDLAAPLQTKNELKEAYGMKKASGIGYEWYQQAAYFANYAVGKTAAEVSTLAVENSEGAPAGADLTASVTISIRGFKQTITRASETAK